MRPLPGLAPQTGGVSHRPFPNQVCAEGWVSQQAGRVPRPLCSPRSLQWAPEGSGTRSHPWPGADQACLETPREAHSHQGRVTLGNWGLPTDFPDTQGQHVSPGDMPPSTARTQGPCTRIHSGKGLTGQIQHGNPSLREQLSCPPQGGWRRGPGEGLTWATGQVPETGPEPGVGTVTGGRLLGSQQTSITWGPPGVPLGSGVSHSPLLSRMWPQGSASATPRDLGSPRYLHLPPPHKCKGKKIIEKNI